MKVVLRTSVESRDQSFPAPDEMSPSLQKVYRRTVERFSAEPAAAFDSAAMIVPKLVTRVILNGKEFTSLAQMPPAYRRFYEEMLVKTLPLDRAIHTVARAEHSNAIKRTISLLFIAAGFGATIVYLWLQGYYG